MYVCVREWRGERDLSKLESKAWFAMEETRERERERERQRERVMFVFIMFSLLLANLVHHRDFSLKDRKSVV